ncbi:MAG: PAS domain-containing protein [Nitrosomonadales bacterium]|jgi:two-component system sensor histidine kinase PilS (NtrC family)|nr:MAG: PAS domain-containing protein [Nitrosomonadales bacterium]
MIDSFSQSKMWQPTFSMPGTMLAEQFWRSLFYFNVYRIMVVGVIIMVTWMVRDSILGSYNQNFFLYVALVYLLFGGISMFLIYMRFPRFNWQIAIQICSDVMFISILMYLSGGIQSGLGLLLLVSLAASGLISRGKLVLFYASIASIGILLEESYTMLYIDGYQAHYVQASLLSMGYFAVAWLAHKLAKHTAASEQLALQRGVDLANMAEINQLVIQDMQDGVLVVDANGEIQQRNSHAEKLINLSPDLLIMEMLVDQAPQLAERLKSWREDSTTNFDLMRIPGSNALVRTRFAPVRSESKASVVIFLEDMSHIQAQAQQLKLAALGRLAVNIAHEIRNPLSSISHACELLEEDSGMNSTHSRLLSIIRDNTRRLNKIVQNVLQLNRRDRATSEVIQVTNFIYTFIDEFCQTEKIDIDAFSINISGQYTMKFDDGHLNQILWNLCNNAWRHCRKQHGSIQLILASEADSKFHLDIIDDGPGIAPRVLNQLFEPFFTTVASGTGLGLYIAREMCEANNASLFYLEQPAGGHFRIVCRGNLDNA